MGPTAIAFAEDPVAGAKLMSEFSDEIGPSRSREASSDGGRVMGARRRGAQHAPGREHSSPSCSARYSSRSRAGDGAQRAPRNLAVVLNQ